MSDASLSKSLLRPEPEPEPESSTVPPLEHPAAGVWKTLSGLRKLQVAFSDPRVRRARSAADVADAEARQLLALRLKRAHESGARTEASLRQSAESHTDTQSTTGTPSVSGSEPETPGATTPSTGLSESYLLTELLAAREQLKTTVEAHASERAAWEAMCDELKARLNESMADARLGAELQGVLEGARAQLRQAIDAHGAELRAR
jgi:hypothetical protein